MDVSFKVEACYYFYSQWHSSEPLSQHNALLYVYNSAVCSRFYLNLEGNVARIWHFFKNM